VDRKIVGFQFEKVVIMQGNKITIPFDLILNHIVITAKVDGKNNINLTIDTGMPIGGVILFRSAKSEHLELGYLGQTYIGGAGGDPASADIASGIRLEIGELNLPDKQVIVMPMNKNVINLLEVDGIIGYELFSKYLLQIDFKKNIINLWNTPDDVTEDLGLELNLELRQNYPFINCSSEITKGEKFPLDLVIDLGAGHAVSLDMKSNQNFSLPQNTLQSRIGTGAIGDIFGHIGRVRKLSIGNFIFRKVVTTFSDGPLAKGFVKCNGNLGIDLLRRFSVTFDYKNSKIYLKPNAYFDEDFVFNMAGFQFHKMDDGNFLVDYIIKNSPADEVGLIKNDVVTVINGKPANLVSADAFDKIIKQETSVKIKLTVKRGTDIRTFEILLRKII